MWRDMWSVQQHMLFGGRATVAVTFHECKAVGALLLCGPPLSLATPRCASVDAQLAEEQPHAATLRPCSLPFADAGGDAAGGVLHAADNTPTGTSMAPWPVLSVPCRRVFPQVEMLLEAYFMQVDNTCNKLQTLHEYIDDTEARSLICSSSHLVNLPPPLAPAPPSLLCVQLPKPCQTWC